MDRNWPYNFGLLPGVVAYNAAGASVTLGTLTLSGSLQNGVSTSGTIIGATLGSTITCNIPGITVNSAARTYSGTPYTTGAIANGLVEALAGATNTPNSNPFTVAATDIPAAASRVAAWYAEDLVTAGLGNNATIGTPGVSPWVDRINGISAVIGTGTPKLKTNAEGTFPSVLFSAAYLTAGQNATLMAAINSKTYTIYVVAKNLLTASTASFVCTSGTSNLFFKADGANLGTFSASSVPFTPTDGTSLFTAGLKGSFTGGGTDGTWVSDNHTIVNGCAVNGTAAALKAATAASDFFIGGQAGATGKYELLELHIYPTCCTYADDIQFHKYVCDKYGKPYPWAALSYVPVLAGDSITNGTLCDTWSVSTPKIVADNLGLTWGQWINASTPAISAASLLLKDAIYLAGLPAQIGITTKIHEFEFVNALTHGANSAQTVTAQQNICNMYRGFGFNKIVLGTTLDYGNRTNTGANSKSAFCAGLAALPAGTYDLLNPLHTDTNIGIDGAAPNTAIATTYFADNIAHPSGHAGWPGVQSGSYVLAGLMSTALAAV